MTFDLIVRTRVPVTHLNSIAIMFLLQIFNLSPDGANTFLYSTLMIDHMVPERALTCSGIALDVTGLILRINHIYQGDLREQASAYWNSTRVVLSLNFKYTSSIPMYT